MNNLRFLRHRAALTQEQMAAAIGTTRNTYVKLEHGTRRLTLSWIERTAAALRIDPGEVVATRPLGPEEVGVVVEGAAVRWTDRAQERRTGIVALVISEGALGAHFDNWRLLVSLARIEAGSTADGAIRICALEDGSFVVRSIRRDPVHQSRIHLLDAHGRLTFDEKPLYTLEVTGLSRP